MLHRLPLARQIFKHRGAHALRLCKQSLSNIQLSPTSLQRFGIVQEPERIIRLNPTSKYRLISACCCQRVFSIATFLRHHRSKLPRQVNHRPGPDSSSSSWPKFPSWTSLLGRRGASAPPCGSAIGSTGGPSPPTQRPDPEFPIPFVPAEGMHHFQCGCL